MMRYVPMAALAASKPMTECRLCERLTGAATAPLEKDESDDDLT